MNHINKYLKRCFYLFMCYTLFEGKKMEIKEIVSKQREYFYTKETYDVKFREKVLLEIKNLLFILIKIKQIIHVYILIYLVNHMIHL